MNKETSKSAWRTMLGNNLMSILLHTAISLAYLVIVLMLTSIPEMMGADAIVTAIIIIGFVLAAGGYVIFSSHYLRPVARGNILSVASLPIGLIAVPIAAGFLSSNAIWFDGGFDHEMASNLVAFTNSPAAFTAGGLYSLVASPIEPHSRTPFSLLIIAAFIPSLLMYVGMRLKLSRETKARL